MMTAYADVEYDFFMRHINLDGGSIWRNLLMDQHRYNVREPRDRVYGMLGMFQHFSNAEALSPLLQPDYGRALVDVYRDATRFAMSSGTLDVLERVRRHVPRPPGLWPSWVPCWHCQTEGEREELELARFHKADGNWTQAWEESIDLNVLMAHGFQIDPGVSNGIRKVSKMVETGSDSDLDQLLAQVALISGIDLNKAPAEDIKDLITTLLAGEDLSHRAVADQDLEDFICLRKYTDKYRRYPPDLRDLGPEPPLEKERAARFCYAMWKATCRRRFFITPNGHYGLGPQSMEAGDIAVVIWGSKWPLILRPLPDVKAYELVGVSYVHGIMAGEAAEDFVKENRASTIFEIR